MLQIPRISKATGLSESTLKSLVIQHQKGPVLGLWGTPMVNVMDLNLALEKQLGR